MNRVAFYERFPPTAFDPSREYPPDIWLVEGLWLGGGKINGVFGTPKSGKSRFVGWLLAAMLGGKSPWRELPLGSQHPKHVLYLRGEESEADISRRLLQYAHLQRLDPKLWGKRLQFAPAMGMMLEQPLQREHLEHMLKATKSDLLIIDPYIRVHGAKENDSTEMARIHNQLRRWADELHIDQLIIHHTGKPTDTQQLSNDISHWSRGASDIPAIVDTATLLQRYGKEGEERVKVDRCGRFAGSGHLTLIDNGDLSGWAVDKKKSSK